MRGGAARVSRLTVRFVLVSMFSLVWAAGAQAAGKRIGVPKFEGAQEALVRKKVMQALKAHGYELVRSRDIADAMSSTGAALDTDDGLKTLAKELALAAIVTGEVGPKRAKIVVHDGGEGSILGDASFAGPNPRKLATEVGLTFWKKLGPDVGRGHVPAGAKKGQKASAASPEDDEGEGEGGAAAGGDSGGGEAAPKPKDDSASAEGAGAGADEAATAKKKKKKPKMEEAPPEEASAPAVPSGLPWLDFELGVGGYNRQLSYNQNVQINVNGVATGTLLRPYSLGSGPIATANVVMYPLDPLFGGALGNIGLEMEIQQGFAISSGSFSNVVHDYAGGGRYRVPFGGTNDFYISATGGEDAFTFVGANRGSLAVPDTIYHYFRPGLGVKMFIVDGFSLALSGGYRVVFNGAGPQLSTPPNGLFPHLTVAGADAEVVAGFRLGDNFEVRAGVEWRRYWFAMHSVATDNNFAGGATDQSFAFTARIAILLGGKSVPKAEGATGGEEAAPPPPPKPHSRKKSSDDGETSGGDSDAVPSVETDHKSGGDADQ